MASDMSLYLFLFLFFSFKEIMLSNPMYFPLILQMRLHPQTQLVVHIVSTLDVHRFPNGDPLL